MFLRPSDPGAAEWAQQWVHGLAFGLLVLNVGSLGGGLAMVTPLHVGLGKVV